MVFFMQKNKLKLTVILMICIAVTSACGIERINNKKTNDVDFTVVATSEIPKEVNQLIEQRKEKEFKVTYSDNRYTYIIVGYGKQKYPGYSIKVKSLYETKNAIFVKTEFIGPEEYTNKEEVTYPYIVIKIQYSDKNVIFGE